MTEANFRASFRLHLPDFTLAPEFELAAEMAVLFGASGAGKSLTLRTLAGLVKPDEGTIRLNGHTIFDSEQEIDLAPQDRGIGYVPQHYALFPHQSISKNIAFGLHNVSSAEREARVAELLARMRLEPLADRKPGEVSGGQQQRTALARALARRPNMLLMDEPFAAVEEDLRAHLREELLKIQKEFAIPVLLVTHSRAEAYTLAERLIVISEGEVVQSGSRDEVFRRPRTPTVARLMGMANILEATVVDDSGSELVVDWGAYRLTIANSKSRARYDSLAIANPESRTSGNSLTLGIRPEEIHIAHDGADISLANSFPARLVKDEPQGADHLLQFEINDQRLDVRVPHPEFMKLELATGQERTLTVDSESIHIVPDTA
ncbi:MAG: ABC transporter ATP-binding protein [Anaerolineales bacterium]